MQTSKPSKSARRRQRKAGQVFVPNRGVPVSTGLSGGSGSRSADVGSALGALLGSSFGPLGGVAGGVLGQIAGRKFGQVTGLGAYRVNRNSLLAADPPVVSNTDSGVRIRHREYLGDVLASQLFDLQYVLSINPGLSASFPWLAGVAQNYQQWKPWGILYEFITTSGNSVASTNTALGEVIMSTQYNSILAPFSNKQQMLNQEYSCNAVPSVDTIHPIECEPQQTSIDTMYVRTTTGGVGTLNGDIRLSDLGTFQLATQGQQSDGGALGSLFVTYDVELFKPTMLAGTGSGDGMSSFVLNAGGVSNNDVLGTGGNESGTLGALVRQPGVSATFTAQASTEQYYAVFQCWSGGTDPAANMAFPANAFANIVPVSTTVQTMGQNNVTNGAGVDVVTFVANALQYYALSTITYVKVQTPGLPWSLTWLGGGPAKLPTGATDKSGLMLFIYPVPAEMFE